jgi:hypothetical protein
MTDETLPTGPGPEAIARLIRERYPEAVVAEALHAWFFSLDGSHWPNFATIVTTDEHDAGEPSRLSRPGVFRLNLGLGKATFERLVGGQSDPDYAALDVIVPHPVYAKQRWISILNPSDATVRDVVLALLDEAHARLADQRRRHAAGAAPTDASADA